MLDQNTDRMWYVIGAVLIGAAIIAMGLNIFSDSFDSVGDNFGSIMGIAGDNIRSIGGSGISSESEIDALVEDGYIPIATAEELAYLNESKEQIFGQGTKWEGLYTSGLDKKYIQVKDIDLGGIEFEPIGTRGNRFKGTFDGGGYTISNLTIDKGSGDYVGLFGFAEGASFKNIGLEDVNVKGGNFVGGLVGRQQSSSTTNSYATGTVTGDSEYVGGLVGRQGSSSTTDSYTTGTVTGTNYVGGLVGDQSSSSTTSSYATGNVTGDSDVGGLVGGQYGSSITSSYATGEVDGSSFVGGLLGNQENCSTTDSYATGNVTGDSYVGGLVGYQGNYSKVISSYATGNVTGTGDVGTGDVGGLLGNQKNSSTTNSYATGTVTGTGSYVGGLVGRQISSSTTSSYYDKETTGQSDTGKGTGKTTVEMKNKDTYVGWDFESIWTIENGQYPTHR